MTSCVDGRRLVVCLTLPGEQSQINATLAVQVDATRPIDRVRLHILENPCLNLGLAALADIVGVSPRHLSRLFRAELGISPIAYVEWTRIDIARRLLEECSLPIKAISHAVGFGSTATLRRAFQRRIGVSPLEYRRRFQAAGPQDAQGD